MPWSFDLIYILCYCKESFISTIIITFCKICWIIFVWRFLFFGFFVSKDTLKVIFNFAQFTVFSPSWRKFFCQIHVFITRLHEMSRETCLSFLSHCLSFLLLKLTLWQVVELIFFNCCSTNSLVRKQFIAISKSTFFL